MSKLKARQEFMVDSKAAGHLGLVSLSPTEFTQLYNEHHSLVRAVAYQMTGPNDLDEIVQQTFIKIWKSFASFRNESKPTSWIYRVTTNTALDFLRSRHRHQGFTDQELSEGEAKKQDLSASVTPERETATKDLVQKGLMALSEDHRTVLVLAFLHDLPLSEVAEVLEVSEGTVKSRLHYAKAAFRDYLGKMGVEL